MSGLMPRFFANFIPVIALMWALDQLLVFRILYIYVFGLTDFKKIAPSLACLIFVILFLLVPFRTCINYCFSQNFDEAEKTYEQVAANFQSDYDIDNPVTKTEGLVRMMELKIATSTNEEEKEQLKA